MNDVTLSGADTAPASRDRDAAPAAPPGYELLDEVGRGGMGIVWRARDLALDREVAVKLLADAYAPDSAAARRFVDEARITGQLQHSGIPAVYQVGTLAAGRPFLAMKLIKGQTLDALLKAGTAVDALSVFAAVSQAVGYAHAHGVIHRDLKPANVMVGSFGEVQVMDWGLAKVLGTRGACGRPESDPEATTDASAIRTERDADTPFTQYGSMLGTPAYMAPEQAAGELDRLGPRADVFGLGAILCTLLTGKPPYDGKDAESVRIAAVRGQTAAAWARLDGCAADPEVIGLCKRCLAFDPGERPATADAVAAEVAALRRAADERVRQAERDKLAAEVRAVEQAKRRRAVQWAAGAVAAVLLLGVAGTSIGLYRVNAARREAEAARRAETEQKKQAEEKEAEARAISRHLTRMLGELKDSPRPAKNTEITIRELLDKAAKDVGTSYAGRPTLEAAVRYTIGENYKALGAPEQEREQFEQVLRLRDQHLGPDHPDAVAAAVRLAESCHALGDYPRAEPLYRRVVAARTAALARRHLDTLKPLAAMAALNSDWGRFDRSESLFAEVRAGYAATVGPDHPDALEADLLEARLYMNTGRANRAIALYARVLAGREAARGPDHPETLRAVGGLAVAYARGNDLVRAEELLHRAVSGMTRVLGANHLTTIQFQGHLADLYVRQGRFDAAVDLYRVVEEGYASHQMETGRLRTALARAMAYWAAGKSDLAAPLARQTLTALEERFHPDDPVIRYTVGDLAFRYNTDGKPELVVALYEQWAKVRQARLGADHAGTLAVMTELAVGYAALGRHPEALALLEETLKLQKAKLGANHPDAVGTTYDIACMHALMIAKARDRGKQADLAMDWLKQAVAAGYRDRAHMEKDSDLDALRGRDDFQKLIESLPKPAEAALPAR